LRFFICGVCIFQFAENDQNPFTTFGFAIFEIGVLFFVSKFFFLQEDEELQIERLESQLEEALRSPGTGMALSYFYNFILPTCANLSSKEENHGVTMIDMEIARGQFDTFSLTNSSLLVFIPRDLEGSDMKAFLRNITMDKKVIQGKPKEKPGKGTHRPMFVYFLEWNEKEKTCNGLFDIPTIISSCYDRKLEEKELESSIPQEILDFQNRLIELISKNPLTKNKVKLISVPSTPFKFNVLQESSHHFLHADLEIEIEEEEEENEGKCQKLLSHCV